VETTSVARSTASAATASFAPAGNGEAPLHAPRPRWLTVYAGVLVAVDAVAMAAATLTSNAAWLGVNPGDLHIRFFAIPYAALVLVTVPTWLVILALVGAYDLGPFGNSDRAVRARIARAGAQLLAVVAVSYYVVRLAMLGRGILMALIPLGVAFTLIGRMGAAAGLHLARRRGHARRTAVVVGDEVAVEAVVHRVERTQAPAITVAGVVIVDGQSRQGRSPRGAPSSNGNGLSPGSRGNGNGQRKGGSQPDPQVVVGAVARTGAETVIIAGPLAPDRLRDIAWRLEGTGVDLLVTPGPGRGEIRPSPRSPVPSLALPHPDL
jgi:hypothetical protein